MTTVLYADVLFIVNFSMDLVSLWVTAKLLSIRQRTWRYALSAALGAAEATAVTAAGIDSLAEAALTLAASAAMVLVAYGFGTVRRFFGRVLALWGAGALIGGTVSALCSVGEGALGAAQFGGTSRLWGLIAVGVLIVWAFVRVIRPKLAKKTARLRVAFGGRSVDAEALVDTGNTATDPISGDAVIFVSSALAARLFGEPDADALASARLDALSDKLRTRVRLVPAVGIGERRVAAAFVPDRVEVSGESTPRRAVVAVCAVPEGHFGGYSALIPPGIL